MKQDEEQMKGLGEIERQQTGFVAMNQGYQHQLFHAQRTSCRPMISFA